MGKVNNLQHKISPPLMSQDDLSSFSGESNGENNPIQPQIDQKSVPQDNESSSQSDKSRGSSDYESSDKKRNKKSKPRKNSQKDGQQGDKQTLENFASEKEPTFRARKLLAVWLAVLRKFHISSDIPLEQNVYDFADALADQDEKTLLKFAKILQQNSEALEIFADEKGFSLIAFALGQVKEGASPTHETDFPKKAGPFVFEVLESFNVGHLNKVVEMLIESKLLVYMKFITMYPDQYCPKQLLKQQFIALLEKWIPALKQARKYARQDDDDEDEDSNGRKIKKTKYYHNKPDNKEQLKDELQRVKKAAK